MSEWQPSKAVIANRENGRGCIIWVTLGSLLEDQMREGSDDLADLGLDDAPPGISIWEGTFVWRPGSWEYPQDGELWPKGAFRAPSDDEWAAIREGRSPW